MNNELAEPFCHCDNRRDFDHMTAKGQGIHSSGTPDKVCGTNRILNSFFATARTVCFDPPNRSQTALWNERDAECI